MLGWRRPLCHRPSNSKPTARAARTRGSLHEQQAQQAQHEAAGGQRGAPDAVAATRLLVGADVGDGLGDELQAAKQQTEERGRGRAGGISLSSAHVYTRHRRPHAARRVEQCWPQPTAPTQHLPAGSTSQQRTPASSSTPAATLPPSHAP